MECGGKFADSVPRRGAGIECVRVQPMRLRCFVNECVSIGQMLGTGRMCYMEIELSLGCLIVKEDDVRTRLSERWG